MYDIHIYILVMRISRIIRYKLGVSVPRRPLQQHLRYINIYIYISISIYIFNINLSILYSITSSLPQTPQASTSLSPLPVTSIPMPGIRAA
jgi:hypothetical protein